MKTPLILISLCLIYSINALPLKRTRGPQTSTTEAGFVARFFQLPGFLKFSHNENASEPSVKTVELPQKSRFSQILDSINIFKKSKPFSEPYLRAYVQPDGSYKWYFVYPGQMLYPAPDQFSFDTINQALQGTTPTTTTTTTTTTPPPPPEDPDQTPKPLYPLLGKIEFVKNETEPKENKWAVIMSDSGPIFQPFGKIRPPFDEPLLQPKQQTEDQDEQEPEEEPVDENQSVTRKQEPVDENQSVTRKHKKHIRTPKATEYEEESSVQPEEPVEDDQATDEPQEEPQEEPATYDNAEPEENEPSGDENAPDDDQEDDEQADEDDMEPEYEQTPAKPPAKKAKSPKPSVT